jgi:hypothetical protein
MVLEGRISEAVNTVVDTDRGRLYQPDDVCSKTGRMVIDILREKHPEVTVPPDEHFDAYDALQRNCWSQCQCTAMQKQWPKLLPSYVAQQAHVE